MAVPVVSLLYCYTVIKPSCWGEQVSGALELVPILDKLGRLCQEGHLLKNLCLIELVDVA